MPPEKPSRKDSERDRRDERSKETAEQRENRLRSSREAQRSKRANETPEQRKARLIRGREAQRIKRQLQTEEERRIRREYESNYRRHKRRLGKEGDNPVESEEIPMKPGSFKIPEIVETPEEREIRLQLTRDLIEVTRQLEITSASVSVSSTPDATTSANAEPAVGAARKNVDSEDDCVISADEDSDSEFENESYREKQPDETEEEWTDRLMNTCMIDKDGETSPPQRSSRQSTLKARARRKRKDKFESKSQNSHRKIGETEEEKKNRRAKEAERNRRRRANETPEQKANRRAKDAERMRLRRKASLPAMTEEERLSTNQSMSAFKIDRLAKLKEELERKKALLANETAEERILRLAENEEKEHKRLKLKRTQEGLSKRSEFWVLQDKSDPDAEVKRILRRRELGRQRLETRRAVLTKEEQEAEKAKAAARARIRIEMEKGQFDLFEALRAAEDISQVLAFDSNQNIINFWYNYKGHNLPQEVAEFRKQLYKTIRQSNESGMLIPVEGLEERRQNVQKIQKMIATDGQKLSEYYSSKRFYMKKHLSKKMNSLDEEGRQKLLEQQRARWKKRYRELYSSQETRAQYNATCRIRHQNRKLGIQGPGRQGTLGRNRGSKGGPGRPRLPTGFYNGTIYPLTSNPKALEASTATTGQDQISQNQTDYDNDDDGGYAGDDGHHGDDPWEPIARAFDACDPSPQSQSQSQQPDKSTICDVCGRKFCHGESLRRHKKYVHEKPGVLEQCPHCPMKFTRASYISWHIKRKHSRNSAIQEVVTAWSCNFCKENFSSEDFLTQHRVAHHEKYLNATSESFEIICDICLKPISTKMQLQKHRKIVHGLDGQRGEFQCPHCPSILGHAEYLRLHIKRIHDDPSKPRKERKESVPPPDEKRPFQCKICNKAYAKDFQLQVHINNKHPRGKHSTCFCEFCGKEIRIRYINDHLRKRHPEQRLQKKLSEATYFIDDMSEPVKKMKAKELQSYIPAMIKASSGSDKPGWGIESKRPPWWPVDVPWATLRTDIRTKEQKKVPWKEALRQIVINCYKYNGKEELLTEFLAESDEEVYVIDAKGKKKRVRRRYKLKEGSSRKKVYKCNKKTCTMTFPEESLRMTHVKEVHPEYSAICEYCGTLLMPIDINRHTAKSHPEEHKTKKQELEGFAQPPELDEINSTALKKMNKATLRSYLPVLVRWSTGKNTPNWGKESERPSWWDTKILPWAPLRIDTRTKEDKQKVPWKQAMKQIVTNCYKFHNHEDLLIEFNADSAEDEKPPRPRRKRVRKSRAGANSKRKQRKVPESESEDESPSVESEESEESSDSDTPPPPPLQKRPVRKATLTKSKSRTTTPSAKQPRLPPNKIPVLPKVVKVILERCDEKRRVKPKRVIQNQILVVSPMLFESSDESDEGMSTSEEQHFEMEEVDVDWMEVPIKSEDVMKEEPIDLEFGPFIISQPISFIEHQSLSADSLDIP